MRIDFNGSLPGQVETGQKTRLAEPASNQQIGAASQTEEPEFSSDTVTISTLANKALEMPSIRQDKVDALRQSIAQGQYQIEPESIADAILSENQK